MESERGDAGSAAMVDAFVAGDENAFALVYTRWSPLIYSVALRTLGDVAAAERVTQGVFTKAWTGRHTADPHREHLSAWLLAITRSELAEARVALGADRSPSTVGSMSRTSGRIEEADETALIERLSLADQIFHLDAVPGQVLRLALLENLTHTEIAERTHLPEATVTNYIERSLNELRQRLEVKTDAC